MGKAPGHDVKDELAVEMEIDKLRERTQKLIVELEERIQGRLSGARETMARVKHTVDVRAQLREHPRAVLGAGAGTLAAVGLAAFFALTHRRRQQQLGARLRRKVHALGLLWRDPERYLRGTEPMARRVLAAVLGAAATVMARALAQRFLQPVVAPRRLPA